MVDTDIYEYEMFMFFQWAIGIHLRGHFEPIPEGPSKPFPECNTPYYLFLAQNAYDRI